jgi:prevent-host-death family protein
MRTVQVFEAKARFSALLAEVEAGSEVAITRHGRVVARLVPQPPVTAADVFAPLWESADEIDLVPPPDAQAEPVVAI